ncbi:hypothetical protein TREMEDRAFT_43808 [Tremella mesenterica DSM 1558]|uniref:uncharacterized protein n=1 Tax=Tremella mesenterica (strain ATCC 24925 / CBS 8224 / DSM 1558 / NBRC 9311 / NRRL Y-6157 / RJB 2259-6 / UBC 559-6) TaxID=578456 RepID=UPI0003F4A31A|nr:uncharacterized protein TREMEDRAFT_43808 [Tremella mesenterica DSM 1558]EIW70190.1 hypothetical protein TREMEDRAFT_43808 [Tremella mesenterica DSM 1558]
MNPGIRPRPSVDTITHSHSQTVFSLTSPSTSPLSSLKTHTSQLRRRNPPNSSPNMFSSRKYSPLPTSSNQHRKRSGGGLPSWKRWIILGTVVLIVLGLGWTRYGGRSEYDGKNDLDWTEENTYTPDLDGTPQTMDDIDYSSPPFMPVDESGDDEDETFHALPIDTSPHDTEEDLEQPSNPHDPLSNEAQDATGAEEDFTEISDETTSTIASFETDPDPSSTVHCTEAYSPEKPLVQYALTIDAGSTGSRIHVYKFHNCDPSPSLEYETFMSINPGLSAHARDPTAAAASLDPLMEEAMRVVPESLHHCSPVEVKATAGLRLLGEQESEAILEEVRNRLETNFPFAVGVYAWITANYLLGKIGEGSDSTDTLAVMDLGGASTQIVFEPKFPADSSQALVEGEHKYSLNFGGKEFTLYQHSYLGYGLMRARRSVHNLVAFTWSFGRGEVEWDALSEDIQVPNPCLSKGTSRRVELDPPGRTAVNVTMHGATGGFEACNRVVELVMAKDAICEVKPCSFNGVYQPSLLDTFPRGQLLALSYFTDRIKPLLDGSELTIAELTSMAKDVCAGPKTWAKRWGKNAVAMAELEDRPEYCLDLTFMNALLGLGYELTPDREMIVEKKLRDVELGWALGAGLALVEKASLTCTA